ncbi:unnamed protein product [Calicophoron daubneyi]|uniref:Protein kinase domain-containing protein n=1 Tax=Calicophoron daubneyi TaxID=300641 RepID=A0AAV2T9I1_CALDB
MESVVNRFLVVVGSEQGLNTAGEMIPISVPSDKDIGWKASEDYLSNDTAKYQELLFEDVTELESMQVTLHTPLLCVWAMVGAVGPGDFDVRRFIGRGCYSIVYEVVKTSGSDSSSRYALKRFFLENGSSVKCVLRERHILERLALESFQSPFLPMLFYGIWYNYSASFILREGSGCDLYDLLCQVGYLSEANARFYLSEIICGLEHLHSLNIVHLDIKPENILFYKDGHVFVSDLDRSFDLSSGKKPTLDDFTGTPLFMAPEIARGEKIDVRSDIWSLGALVAEMVAGPIRSDAEDTAKDFQRARTGSYTIRGLKSFSKPLQSFFAACLQRAYTQRPYLKDLKKLRFLKFVDWQKVITLSLQPPYTNSDLHHRLAKEDRGKITSTDQRVLLGAFSPTKPVHFKSHQKKKNPDTQTPHDRNNNEADVLCEALVQEGYTLETLDEEFKSFNFVHPCLDNMFKADDGLRQLSLIDGQKGDEPVRAKSLMPDAVENVKKVAPSSPVRHRRPRKRGISVGD